MPNHKQGISGIECVDQNVSESIFKAIGQS